MDSPYIQNVINSFTTIPSDIITQFLKDNSIMITSFDIYQTALNVVFTKSDIKIPEIIDDWILAWNITQKYTNLNRYDISTILTTPNDELVQLSLDLGLNYVSKERIIRILKFLDIIDDNLILFAQLPEELLLRILEYFDCESLSLVCKISDTFEKLCTTNKFIKLVRRKITNETGFTTNMMSFDMLQKLCYYKRQYLNAGFNHSLIITKTNQLYKLGDYHQNKFIPQHVSGLNNIIRASAGIDYSLLINSDRRVYELVDNKSKPLLLYHIISIAVGNEKSLALHETGFINIIRNTDSNHIITETFNHKIIDVSAGNDHFLLLDEIHQVYLYRYRSSIKIADNIVSVSAKGNLYLLLDRNGQVYKYINSQLEMVPGLTNIISISAGVNHSLVLDNNGKVYAHGNNSQGQLGIPNHESDIYSVIPNLDDVIEISAGDNYSLVLTATGNIYGFGANNYGQLGLGDNVNRSVPTLIMNIF